MGLMLDGMNHNPTDVVSARFSESGLVFMLLPVCLLELMDFENEVDDINNDVSSNDINNEVTFHDISGDVTFVG